jgi:16S rRNA processing protein RimM
MFPEPTVVVGKITKPHGLKGELNVLVFSDNPDRFAPGSVVFCEDGTELKVRSSRGGPRAIVAFDGIEDRSSADRLKGRVLVVPESMLPALPAGEYWPSQLEGCEVMTESGRSLGSLVDVVANPANDLWVTRAPDGAETLVPAIREVIVDVDVTRKRVLVRDVPGLTAPEDPNG